MVHLLSDVFLFLIRQEKNHPEKKCFVVSRPCCHKFSAAGGWDRIQRAQPKSHHPIEEEYPWKTRQSLGKAAFTFTCSNNAPAGDNRGTLGPSAAF